MRAQSAGARVCPCKFELPCPQVSEADGASLTFSLSLAVEFAAFEKKRGSLNEQDFCDFCVLTVARESNEC